MPKLTDVMGRPFTGLVPTCVVGLCTDNKDPDKLGRIKVKFPTLDQEPESYWLRIAAPNAGAKTNGFYALPEVDDEVLVLFMQGSQDVGVVIGQFWNGVDKPPPEADSGMPGSSATGTGGGLSSDTGTDGSGNYDKNDRRLWRSRSGHLFVFDDSDGKESVQIWDKGHKLSLWFDTAKGLIILANNDKDIHIRAKQHVFVEAGQDIKFKAGNNFELETGVDTKIKAGSNIDAKANSNVTITANANMDLKGTAGFTAKGATTTVEADASATFKGGASAELNGGGMCKVGGGMVMIN